MEDNNNKVDKGRRGFLKALGFGTAAGVLSACGVKDGDKNALPFQLGDDDFGKGEMTYRMNHNTGDKVSILGYGMMRLPTIKKTEGENTIETIDQEKVNELVDYAMEHGVNYYDTSPVYCMGKSEEATGIALSRYPRDKYFIATKLSNFSPDTQSRKSSIEMFENSLEYLRTDYIDYLLLHAIGGGGMPAFNQRFMDNGILDWLVEQKEKGRIRNLGFSYHGDVEVFDTMLRWHDEGRYHWDFVQIQLNYPDWFTLEKENHATNAEYLYNELAKREIPAVIMEPLLGGRLANISEPLLIKMLQRRQQDNPATWAFRFAGTPDDVLTVLSGMTYKEHLVDNLRTYSPLKPLDEDEIAFIEMIAGEYLQNNAIPCTGCKYCMPCPYGVDIPSIFAHYNKCITEDNTPRDNRDPNYADARKAFLVGYDRSVPRMRQAERCIGCGWCITTKHCPQNIAIPKQMEIIDSYVTRLKAGKA